MNDQLPPIRLPLSLLHQTELTASTALDEDAFKTHELQFIQAIFGYGAFLEHADAKPPCPMLF
jgi:hypothetical protein